MVGKFEIVAYYTLTTLAASQTGAIPPQKEVWIWVSMGALGGALVGALTPQRITHGQRAIRWIVSFICAALATLPTTRLFGIPRELENVAAIAGLIGVMGWWLVKAAQTQGPEFFIARWRAMIGLAPAVKGDQE